MIFLKFIHFKNIIVQESNSIVNGFVIIKTNTLKQDLIITFELNE